MKAQKANDAKRKAETKELEIEMRADEKQCGDRVTKVCALIHAARMKLHNERASQHHIRDMLCVQWR